MNKHLFFVTIALLLIVFCIPGCDTQEYPQYEYAIDEYVPDTNKTKMAEWIRATMSASSFHMSGGDYEDPEDVIWQLNFTANELFSVHEEGLYLKACRGCTRRFIAWPHLTKKEKDIFNNLRQDDKR